MGQRLSEVALHIYFLTNDMLTNIQDHTQILKNNVKWQQTCWRQLGVWQSCSKTLLPLMIFKFLIWITQTIIYQSSNATLFGFDPIVICIFPSFFSCYFSRNQNGKGSSYGLLFSHVETILVMVSKESFAVSGIIYYVCSCWLERLCQEKKNSDEEQLPFLIVGRKNSSAIVIIGFSPQSVNITGFPHNIHNFPL